VKSSRKPAPKTPLNALRKIVKRLRQKSEKRRLSRQPYAFSRIDLKNLPSAEWEEAKVLNILEYTKTTKTSQGGHWGKRYPAGYHHLDVPGLSIEGQRNASDRLKDVPVDFTGKTVLDIGSNQGGMLFALNKKAKWGVGVDYDPKMVNASNYLNSHFVKGPFEFFTFDIDGDPHDLLRDFLPEARVDVVFLLSVCMHVAKWRELIEFVSTLSDTVLFESNGSAKQQEEQIEHLKKVFSEVKLLSQTSRRKVLLATL
jgi:2-polyprenyl-3-methyl-5-hydroxy-6-metoxy-1,4-benzoquinol methylase